MKSLKKYISYITLSMVVVLLSTSGCKKVLDITPNNKLPVEKVLSNPAGVKAYMANLYYLLPIEGFLYFPNNDANATVAQFGFNGNGGGPNNGGQVSGFYTDEAAHSEDGWARAGDYNYWSKGYQSIRDINYLIDAVPGLASIPDAEKNQLLAEAHFLRAFVYFGLAKRYGGLSLIKEVQIFEGDIEAVKVPRSTEKETWDFVMSECDLAISGLPPSWSAGNERRASKFVAYALKSRAALHAASVAKFWNKALLDPASPAVMQKLVGMDASVANGYYDQSIKASEAIMNSGQFNLYMPTPANPDEAAANYTRLFQDPNVSTTGNGKEVIFIKGHSAVGDNQGHNYDIWFTPNQLANGWPHPGRFNPSLFQVDAYENYSTPGQNAPVNTRTDNNVTDYTPFAPNKPYIYFDKPQDAFADKDARLRASIILPGASFKGVPIIIQAGLVRPDGTNTANQNSTNASVTLNGTTYYTFGGGTLNEYSGFHGVGGNYTTSGFLLRKFLRNEPVSNGWNQSTSDWAEFRYAEILLNYAEAVVESGLGNSGTATAALNATRRRAAHMTTIPLTVANVLRERQVELAFENKRYWDLIRRRDYHILFDNNQQRILQPILDLRVSPAKYIMVRTTRGGGRTFQIQNYYRSIDGIGTSGLIQNPTR